MRLQPRRQRERRVFGVWGGDMTRSVWRKRRTLKWVGLLLCLMMLGLWVISVLYGVFYVPPKSRWGIGIESGMISSVFTYGGSQGWNYSPKYSSLKTYATTMPWTVFAHYWLGLRLPGKTADGLVYVPFWLLVVATGLPTAILWWRDRRPKAGFCKVCKYDLMGNVSGACPECGTAVENASETNEATTPTDGA